MHTTEPISPPPPTGRDTVLIALGQGAVMVLGGLLALLIAQLFGRSVETDAFFAAYGVYALGVAFTQSFRLTALPELIGGGQEAVTRMVGAVAAMAAVLAIPMVVLAPVLGGVLVARDPSGVAPDALRILWVAMAGQLLAAMLATALIVRGRFKPVGHATLMVGMVSLGTFLMLEGALGILAGAVGLAVGGVWLTVVLAGALVADGWRPHGLTRAAVCAVFRAAGGLTFASLFFLATSVAYVISVAVAARQGEGEATLFAYAYVLAGVLLGVTANVAATVRSPSLVGSRDRTKDAMELGMWSLRFTVVLAGPVLALALLVGKPVIGFLFGPDFEGAGATSLLVTLACLVGWLLGTASGLFAVVELLARGERVRLALLAGAQIAAIGIGAPLGAGAAGIEGIGVALSIVALGTTAALLYWAFGDRWRALAGDMARVVGREAIVLIAAFAPSTALVLVVERSAPTLVAAGLLASVLAALATCVAWPRESAALLAVLPRRRTAG